MDIPKKSFEPEAPCPLDGVRVLDMSRLVSGNMVSLQLADFGVEVVKIRDPKRGDPLRAWQTDGISIHWKIYSRNKKSVALSLREPRGRKLLTDLAAGAQVLIENFRPGTLEFDGSRPRGPAPAQPRPDHRAGFRLGSGRAIPRPPRLWHIEREHVGVCRPHRLCRSRAGLAADGTRRHGRRSMRCNGGAGRVARDRGQGRQGSGD